MGPLTQRRQALLLVVVGALAGVLLVCVGLELIGVPVLEPFGVDELFTRHEPSRIVVEGGAEHADPDSSPVPTEPVSVPTRLPNGGAP
jgi:hypothetical protein